MSGTLDDLPLVELDQPAILTFSKQRLELQTQSGVCRVRTPAGDQAWLVTRYAEAKTLLSGNQLARSHSDPVNAPRFIRNSMVDMLITDAPLEAELKDHNRKRGLYTVSFAARRVLDQRIRVGLIAERLIDAIIDKGRPADLHEDWAVPFSRQALCDMVGVPVSARDELLAMMDRVGDTTDEKDSSDGMILLSAAATSVAAGVRRQPGDDVVSRFIEGGMSDAEAGTHIIALLFAGLSGLVSHIDYGTLLLLQHPDQREKALADPEIMTRAVEEVLRITVSSPVLPRYAQQDIEIDGVTIREGDLVMVDFSLASNDPRVFPEPSTFDVTRSPNPHLAFSHGPRHCTGAPLVRIALHVAYTTLFTRLPSLRLAVPYSRMRAYPGGRLAGGLAELPVIW